MDCNGVNLYELISEADQILLYKTRNVHSTTISGQQIIQDLMDEDVALLQRCVYGCVERQAKLKKREKTEESGSEPKGDPDVPEKKGRSNKKFKRNSEDTEGAHCEPTEKVNDKETDTGNVEATEENDVKRKVSQSSGESQDES